jgi:NitT/TauT family transport system ATP-binding protein
LKATQAASAIEVRGLSKSYLGRQGRYGVLEQVSLTIRRGEFVSLLGPSGGGKSTLLNILAGLEPPDAGTATIFGCPAGRGRNGRSPIAYMQQKDLLLPWRTLWENILLGPELRSAAERRRLEPVARQYVTDFHLDGFAHAFPAQLSGGMRQRAALIRTLLCEPEILLLDEPFGALDAITRARLQAILLRVWRELGKTVLLVTHDVEEAVLLSGRVLLMSGRPGRVQREFPIPLPYEARRSSPESLRLEARILEDLERDETGD